MNLFLSEVELAGLSQLLTTLMIGTLCVTVCLSGLRSGR